MKILLFFSPFKIYITVKYRTQIIIFYHGGGWINPPIAKFEELAWSKLLHQIPDLIHYHIPLTTFDWKNLFL